MCMLSCIFESFLHLLYPVGEHLPCKMQYLCLVTWILEDHNIARVQTDCSELFCLLEEILGYQNYREVAMMRSFCEQFFNKLASLALLHQIIKNEQVACICTKIQTLIKSMHKFNVWYH